MRRAVIPLVALALASFGSPAAAEQGLWQPRLSLYSGDFYSIAYASATTVWAVGPGGVLISDDGGAVWRWTLNRPLHAVDPAGDGLHGWAVGADSAVFATGDGGKTWAQQRPGIDVNLDAVGALDAERAIAIGYPGGGPHPQALSERIPVYTDDGGATWQRGQYAGRYSFDSVSVLKGTSRAWASAIKCTETTQGGCVGERVLLASDDAGKTWDEIASGQELWYPQFTSASTGWAASSGALLRTRDGGKSWKAVREFPFTIYVLALSALSDDAAIILLADVNSPDQQIARTTDGGATWADVGGPIRMASRLRYFDEMRAVRVNLGRAIEWSKDGGVTWQTAALPAFATPLGLAVDLFDPLNGWASASRLLRTRDGGETWEAASDLQFESVDFVSPTEGWAAWTDCGTYTGPCQGVVMHSVDGGATWTEQVRHEGSDVPRVRFVDRLNGWMTLGQDKPVLHTRDGGLTWSAQQFPGSGAFAFVDRSTVWAASDPAVTGGNAVSVYLSKDGGDSWSPAGMVPSEACWPELLAAVDAAHAWLVSPDCVQNPRGALLRTVDGGASWQEVSPMSEGNYEYLRFFTASDGLAVRTVCPRSPVSSNDECEKQLLRTRDGGHTWTTEVIPPVTSGFEEYRFIDLWHGWRVDTVGGGITEVVSQSVSTYSATPSAVLLPETGEGRDSGLPLAVVAALGGFGAVCVGLGRLVRMRSPRRR
jgi:photosystem II stability/assembly factor-like uncharacterized protein